MKISIIGGGPGGLYFALLAKKEWPEYDITVYERNKADDTFGFGVVFSDETLGIFRDYDEPSYEAIRASFAYWDDVEIAFQGERFRVAGNGFAGCSRKALLLLLQERCRALGVTLRFETECGPEQLTSAPLADSHLIVAADGINSRIRTAFEDDFGTSIDTRNNMFCWLGSTRELDAFYYFFRQTDHGPVVAHCYQYEPGRSTWVIELAEDTWRGLGLDRSDDEQAEHLPIIESIFAEELEGHRLIDNRSLWRKFPMIRNETWVKDNIVLLGDAKATAHYSVGAGTKLAMEDAIGLLEAMRQTPDIPACLATFESQRRDEVGKTQHAADVSLQWFESMARHWHLAPEQFAFGVMSRSKQITYENLMLRDASFVDRVRTWFLDDVRTHGFDVGGDTPPMFTPLRLREMLLTNRVVVSPMAQYSARDGVPTDWHFQHLTSRALGGAGLLFVEMTCPSPEARITPGCTGLWNDTQCAAWKRIVDFIHAETTTKVCLQLGHAGRKGSTQLGWQKMDHPLRDGNWPLVSASPLPYLEGTSQVPAALDEAAMEQVIDSFVNAARYAEQADFDMLEIHMAHGYLLASFISPLTNQRSDDYGGSIENRMRFPLAVFSAVRKQWPRNKPMSVRISACDWAEGGLSAEDLIVAARMLQQAKVDLIDVSTGQTVPWQAPVYGRMYQTVFADLVKHELFGAQERDADAHPVAIMAVGNITSADQINTVLLQGRADLVAIARGHLTNPYFTLHAAAAYDYRGHAWPRPYESGRDQAFRLAEREREDNLRMRAALKPERHANRDDD